MSAVGAGAREQPDPSGGTARVRSRQRAWAIPLAVGGVVLLAAALRVWNLGTKSLWYDEAFTVFIAQQSPQEIIRLLRVYDTHPPLHYLLVHLWIALFGKSEVVVRLPSVLASLGVLILTFLLARRLAGERTALLATAFLATSPFQIASAQEARMYPFLTLFGVGSAYALWLALEEQKPQQWLAYTVCILLALATHYFALLLLGAQALYVLGIHRAPGARRAWLGAVALVAVAYLPLVPLFVSQFVTARHWPDIRPPFGVEVLADLFGLLSFGGESFGMGAYFWRGRIPLELRAALLLPFTLLVIAGTASFSDWRRRAYLLALWLVPIAAVALVSVGWNLFYERYFSFVLPAFAIVLAAGVLSAADLLPDLRRVAAACMLVVVAAFIAPGLANLYWGRPYYNWRGAAQHVTARARPNDLLVFLPAFGRIPFDYYFRGPQARMTLSPRRVLGPQGDAEFMADGRAERVAAIARRHPRMWIVSTLPVGYERRKDVARMLAPYFREVEGVDFGQVFTFLWESRVYEERTTP